METHRNFAMPEDKGDTPNGQNEDRQNEDSLEKKSVIISTDRAEENTTDVQKEDEEKETVNSLCVEVKRNRHDSQNNVQGKDAYTGTNSNFTISKDKEHSPDGQNEDQEREDSTGKNSLIILTDKVEGNIIDVKKEDEKYKNVSSLAVEVDGNTPDSGNDDWDKGGSVQKIMLELSTAEKPEGDKVDIQKENLVETAGEMKSSDLTIDSSNIVNEKRFDEFDTKMGQHEASQNEEGTEIGLQEIDDEEAGFIFDGKEMDEGKELASKNEVVKHGNLEEFEDAEAETVFDGLEVDQNKELASKNEKGTPKNVEVIDSEEAEFVIDTKEMDRSKELTAINEEGMHKILGKIDSPKAEPVFEGTEIPGKQANRSTSTKYLNVDLETQGYAWPERAVALTNFVREKSMDAISSLLHVFSVKSEVCGQDIPGEEDKDDNIDDMKEVADLPSESKASDVSLRTVDRSGCTPSSHNKISCDVDATEECNEATAELLKQQSMKGRILLYTKLGCRYCREARLFLHQKKLGYFEVNLDLYPSRKFELEEITGSSDVPRVFFNEINLGGLSELKTLDEAGELNEKIETVIAKRAPYEAPLPPLSGEDDVSNSGVIDELALVVLKMKESIAVKDRFYKMHRFTNCFLGSEAVDFLSEDQYLERNQAVEFGRKLACKLFFQHVLDENVFEDGEHLYRFLDHDPIVISQCFNIPRGITEVKPKPITEISLRLRVLYCAILEAYTSEDGKHVDYRSLHGSEEFQRYLRVAEELQRVDLQDMRREEKLAFFINLFNMMAMHAILNWGHPSGPLERRNLLVGFKYVIGGCTYSLSDIQNGILRGNQRPPYSLTKPFGMKDKRSQVALSYPEPLIHFALVCGTWSGPALRCYSPGNIDHELMEAARNFLQNGGLIVDLDTKVSYVSKILKWYGVDFGKNEIEVLRHAANYLQPNETKALLDLLATGEFKVVYQTFDWSLNN